MTSKRFKLIDLFCGCGGMTEGFIATERFKPVFANDDNPAAMDSYRANFDPGKQHTDVGDINRLLEDKTHLIPQADVVIGGPPCQGFSLLNKNRNGDSRRQLWRQFLETAEIAKAKVIVMENVQQLLSSDEFEEICDHLDLLDYQFVQGAVLNSADYGVAEVRKRTIVMASKKHPISLPRPTHCSSKLLSQHPLPDQTLKPWADVRSVIGDLPAPIGTEIRDEPSPLDLQFGRNPTPVSMERYKAVPLGGNRFDLQNNRPDITPNCWIKKKSGGTDIFGRLWWERPSVTIRTEFYKPEKGRYLHPDQHRPITHREAARIQSFPDEFKFHGTKIEIARQIGNAVPPLLAQAIAQEVIACLENATDAQYVAETNARLSSLTKTIFARAPDSHGRSDNAQSDHLQLTLQLDR